MRFRLFGRLFSVPKPVIYIVCGILIAAAVIAGKYLTQKNDTTVIEKVTASPVNTVPESTPSPAVTVYMRIYVVGCVESPGVYDMLPGTIIRDLIDAAGGFTEEADREHINLAYPLSDGMMVRAPSKTDEDKTFIVSGVSEKGFTGGKVNINTADVAAFLTLPGIGESTAEKIVAYREEHGRFETIEEIMEVPGIKEGKFASIKDLIVA